MTSLRYRPRFSESVNDAWLVAFTERALSSMEKDAFANFRELVDDRLNLRFIKSGMCQIKGMTIVPESRIEVTQYDQEDFYSFLLKLRPLILRDERNSFMNILAMVKALYVHDEAFLRELQHLEFSYRHGDLAYFMQISFNNNPIFHPDAMYTWLNTRIFHQDVTRESKMAAVESAFGKEGGEGFFAAFISDQWRSICYLRAACSQLLDSTENHW